MTEGTMNKYPETVTERTCATCREWFINKVSGERECMQIHCEDYSDWVERPSSQPKE